MYSTEAGHRFRRDDVDRLTVVTRSVMSKYVDPGRKSLLSKEEEEGSSEQTGLDVSVLSALRFGRCSGIPDPWCGICPPPRETCDPSMIIRPTPPSNKDS